MAKMSEGQCKTTKNGMRYCMINGRVRFTKKAGKVRGRSVRGVKGVEGTDSLMGLGDPVGVSMAALRALARGARSCITAVTPEGIKSICRSATGGKARRKKSVAGLGRKRRKTRRTRSRKNGGLKEVLNER